MCCDKLHASTYWLPGTCSWGLFYSALLQKDFLSNHQVNLFTIYAIPSYCTWYFHASIAGQIIFPPQTGQLPWLLRSCSATSKRICIPTETRFFLVFLQRNTRAYQYAQPKKTDKIIKQSGIGCNNFLSAMKLPMAQTGNYLHVVLTGSHLFRAEHCILKRSRKEEHQLHSDRFAQLFRKPEELDSRC